MEMNFDPDDFERYQLHYGDILLSEASGSADEVGNLERSTGYSLSAGTGIHWTYIKLDVAYTYSSFDLTYDFADQEFRSRNHQFNMMFTGYF